MTTKKIESLIRNYLSMNHIHCGSKVKQIKNETVSTYDGQYPSFEVIYEGKQPKYTISRLELTKEIEKYTTLKYNKDYWIGISWEE